MKPSFTQTTAAVVVALLGTADKVFGFSYPDCVNGPLASNKVCDVKASPADRAAALVGALNTTEKLTLLVQSASPPLFIYFFVSKNNPQQTDMHAA